MIVSGNFTGLVGLGVRSALFVSGFAPFGFICASSILFLSNISTLITNNYFSKLQIRYFTLGDWIVRITLLYKQALKQSMVDKEINEKEALELKKIYNHYLDKRKK